MFEPETTQHKTECAHCNTVATHDDDFCHECGYAYSARLASDSSDAEQYGDSCPSCLYGEIHELSYGIRQCDSCGYTARDWSTN